MKHSNSFIISLSLYFSTLSAATSQSCNYLTNTSVNRSNYITSFSYDQILLPDIVIPAVINGKQLPFIVDTGAHIPLVINRWVADKFKLRSIGETFTVPKTHFSLTQTVLPHFCLFGQEVDNFPFAFIANLSDINDTYSGPRIAGIIGLPLLEKECITFDFNEKRMMVNFEAHHARKLNMSSSLPIHVRNGLFFVNILMNSRVSVELLIDTGSDLTDLPLSIKPLLKPTAHHKIIAMSLYKLYEIDMLLLQSLKLGQYDLNDVEVGCVPSDVIPHFGLDILSQFRVTLDFPNRNIIIEQPTLCKISPKLRGQSGVYLINRQGHYLVNRILQNSAAKGLDIRPNDCIVKVDGKLLDPLPLNIAQRLLDGFANTKAEILLRHSDGHMVLVSLIRKSYYDK